MEKKEGFESQMDKAFEYVSKAINALPPPLQNLVRSQIEKVRDVLLRARPPRFAIIGRRGAGKSSLINAIYGNYVAEVGDVKSTTSIGTWYDYNLEKRKLSILDTRGVGDGSVSSDRGMTSEDEVKKSLTKKCPDVLLFLCKADEVDARIDEDLQSLKTIKSFVIEQHNYNPPIIGIITQVDKLAPAQITDPPYDDERKQKNINEAQNFLHKKMAAVFDDVIKVIPISAYIDFRDGILEYDRRWNIDTLIDYLIDHLPNNAKMELARTSKIKSAQKKVAKILITGAATITGAIGLQPIPVADLPFITAIQIGMIVGIGYISGRDMNKKAAKEFTGALGLNLGLSFAFRELARAMVKLIPFAGNAVSGSIAAGATWGMGKAAIVYFIDKKPAIEAKTVYEIESKELNLKELESTLEKVK